MITAALVKRILREFMGDKRTIIFALFAPILIFTLIYFIPEKENETAYNIGIISSPEKLIQKILSSNEERNINFFEVTEENDKKVMEEEDLTIVIDVDENFEKVTILIDGSNATKSAKAKYMVTRGVTDLFQEKLKDSIEEVVSKANKFSGVDSPLKIAMNDKPTIEYKYVYGVEDAGFFDKFGAVMIGILVFVFVYLLGGINFLLERTSGTLEKMLTTPIKRRDIIFGYILSFSILAIVQTLLVNLYIIYVLKVRVVGSVGNVILINAVTALVALSLGLLLSSIAKSEFQMIQFVPVVITPQIFLCGLFTTNGIWEKVSYIIPLRYTVDALKKVMIKGYDISYITFDLLMLLVFFVVFMGINITILKRYRVI